MNGQYLITKCIDDGSLYKYDLSPLISQQIEEDDIDPIDVSYYYFFNLETQIDTTIFDSPPFDYYLFDSCEGSHFCQACDRQNEPAGTLPWEYYTLGNDDFDVTIFWVYDSSDLSKGYSISYTPVETPGISDGNYRYAHISVKCNSLIDTFEMQFVEEHAPTYDGDGNPSIRYDFIIESTYGCPVHSKPGFSNWTWGSYFCLVFFVFFGIYIIVGTIVNAVQKEDPVFPPHAEMWATFYSLIKDGIMFVFCCKKTPPATIGYERLDDGNAIHVDQEEVI
ncbi:Autophagy-related protein 27 like protein [Aduncisulcus paluster]|uniref:Autophagy-related protein 27 n=1 Tax=Aduncisulcus paluster TaxID=2918883 RepID=A0ABQ5KWL0_9EUKA|nr:Autophagy-related protein 27 like protein [Aduncisulcus paluster]